ncbi:hypothetical protein GEMRC1_006189 [Eukaryota sp. GEM-RC1]
MSRLNEGRISDNSSDIVTFSRKSKRPLTRESTSLQKELSASIQDFLCTHLPSQFLDPDECPFINTGVNFWHLLASGAPREFENWMELQLGSKSLNCLVPDTIVLGDPDHIFWLATHSTPDGNHVVVKKTHFEASEALSDLLRGVADNGGFVLQKKKSFNKPFSSETSIIDTKELSSLLSKTSEHVVIQRYIKPRGIKATVYRVFLNKSNAPKIIAVSNEVLFNTPNFRDFNLKYLVNVHDAPVTLFNVSHTALDNIVEFARNVNVFVQRLSSDYRIDDFVCDFVIDDQDQPWFVQCKAMTVTNLNNLNTSLDFTESPVKSKPVMPKRCLKFTKCRCCMQGFPASELEQSLTMSMIKQLAYHLHYRGVSVNFLNFSNRSDLSRKDDPSQYQNFRVCKKCYSMYLIEKKLMDIESKFARQTGTVLTDSNHPGGSSLTLEDLTRGSYIIGKELKKSTNFRGFRILIFVRDLIGLSLSDNIDSNTVLLQHTFFNNTLSMPVYITQETSEVTLLSTPRSKGQKMTISLEVRLMI